MNEGHLTYLASPEWESALRSDLLPWLRQIDLGDDVLEIGPGPGLTTDLLREIAHSVTAVELDADLAAALAQRLAGTPIAVIHGDGTALDLASDRFSAVTSFSMLHHMPEPRLQDRLFAEAHRVLRPGGNLVGVDGLDTERIRQAHVDDVFVPVDPQTLSSRLAAAGFADSSVTVVSEHQFRFTASKAAS